MSAVLRLCHSEGTSVTAARRMVAKHISVRRMACTTSIQPGRFPTTDTTEAVIFDLDDCCSALSLSFERFCGSRLADLSRHGRRQMDESAQ
jgi:hypothetical protein